MTYLKRNLVPTVLILIVVAAYLSFVFGYPHFFPGFEKAHPKYYKQNVAKALAAGKRQRAVKIARQAASVYPEDPAAFTLYGRLLLEDGATDAALAQFESAVNITQTPAPDYRFTSKPYYFADARLALGKLSLDRGDSLNAVSHFEFARPYAVLTAPDFEAYHPMLHSTYAACGQWSRALEFGKPSDRLLGELDTASLVGLAATCEGLQRWDLALEVAQELAARDPEKVTAYYLSGRACLASNRLEEAQSALTRAVAMGHPDAPFFLGLALEQAGNKMASMRAFLKTKPESLFRPFALAKVLIFGDEPGHTRQALLEELDREIARPRRFQRPRRYNRYQRFWPIAVDFAPACFESCGAFPILILWEDREPTAGKVPETLFLQLEENGVCTLKLGKHILQLQWTTNKLTFSGFEALTVGETELPGWRKTPYLWPEPPGKRVAAIASEESGNRFLTITNTVPESHAMLITAPVRVEQRAVYMLAGRVKATDTMAWFVWTALDKQEREAFHGTLKQSPGPDWTWLSAQFRAQANWDSLTVHLGVYKDSGTLAYDDVMLLEVREPALLLDSE